MRTIRIRRKEVLVPISFLEREIAMSLKMLKIETSYKETDKE